MKHVNKICTFLLTTAIAASLPMVAEVFKKVVSAKTQDIGRKELTGVSPRRHQAPPAREPASSGLRLRGLVVNADEPYIGEITIDGNDIRVTNIHSDYTFADAQSAVYADGRFYTQYLYQPYIGETNTNQTIYDAYTWEILEEREELPPSSNAVSMTYDPSDCTIYGYFANDENDDTWLGFGRMNIATGETYLYNSVDNNEGFLCIAASPDGYLYGVNVSGQYCRINKNDGVITVLGHTDVKPMYLQSATFDWETGDFYWAAMTDTGESILYTIDPVTYMARKIGNLPNGQEFIGLYVARDPSPSQTPAAVSGIETLFDGASLSGSLSFDVPETTVDGNALTGNVKAHAAVDGKSFTVDAQPGQSCTIPVSVDTNGLYILTAWISDEKAQGEKVSTQKWIGADYPGPVQNVVCVNDNGHITLTWEAPSSVGQHGGYVDTDALTYYINRDGGGIMTTVKDITECRFEQDFPADVTARVTYSVRAVYDELAGPVSYSNEVSVGNSVHSVPFSFNAASSDDRIIIDANNDGTSWESSWGYAMCETPDGGADDWLLTPPIALKAGGMYELTYEVSAQMGFLSPQTIEVKMGTGNSAADMTFDIDTKEVTTIRLTQPDTETSTFTAPANGNYRLGFRNASATSGTLGLAQIQLKELGVSSGPVAPSACKVEAAPYGELKATVSFTAPAEDSDGNAIDALSCINVYRGSAVVGSIENPVPGQRYSVTDNNASQGDNFYEIGAIGADGAEGPKAKVSGWVGIDIPMLPYDINIREEGNSVVVSWKISEKGIHDGYVNPEEVVVSLLDPVYLMEYLSVQGQDQAVITFEELTGQALISFALSVSNAAGANPEAAITPTIAVGPSYQLPFFETFPNGKVKYSWATVGSVSDDQEFGWMPVTDNGPDGTVGVSTYWGYFEDDEQGLRSRRISLKGADDPTLRFYLMARSEDNYEPALFRVQISETFDNNYTTIYEKEVTEDVNEWNTVEISLNDYVGKDVFIQFVATPSYGGFLVGIDDISIRNALDYDASFEAISLDNSLVEVGSTVTTVNARVQNHGTKDLPAGSYNVNFYAGNRLFATMPGQAMPAAFGQSVYNTEYNPDIDDSDPSAIRAEIVSDIDQNSSNNISDEVSIDIDKPYCPAVTDLTAQTTDTTVELAWSEPDQSGFPVREITDDFESYRNFSINNAGEWTIIDEDQSPGVVVSYFFPGSAGPIGWMVLEPASIPRIGGGTHADNFPAYSGDKYIVAYNPSSRDNDDWLITPELSGRAQEISFMARAESAKAGREMFEVYYSTTGTGISDMIRLDDVDWRTTLDGWEEFKFRVPEGAKYFAVRCVSHSRVAMHIDDFKYESAATPLKVTLLGYNVYRNGEKINDEVITSLSFCDMPGHNAESVIYTVRAVYDCGEASHSNPVTVSLGSFDGVDHVYMDVDPATQPVYDLNGRRMHHLTEGEIYVTKDRRFIYKAK